jgi:hypothetical protein
VKNDNRNAVSGAASIFSRRPQPLAAHQMVRDEARAKMKLSSRENENMATAPARKKLPETNYALRTKAEEIADLVVGAVEKKLSALPKQLRMKQRDRLISSLKVNKAKR